MFPKPVQGVADSCFLSMETAEIIRKPVTLSKIMIGYNDTASGSFVFLAAVCVNMGIACPFYMDSMQCSLLSCNRALVFFEVCTGVSTDLWRPHEPRSCGLKGSGLVWYSKANFFRVSQTPGKERDIFLVKVYVIPDRFICGCDIVEGGTGVKLQLSDKLSSRQLRSFKERALPCFGIEVQAARIRVLKTIQP